MAHTLSSLHYHIVFSTKGRRNLIPQEHLARLHAYVASVVRNTGGQALMVGGDTNHLHALVSLPPDLPVSKAVNVIKSNSSKWVHETFASMAAFGWQEGYAAFTVSKSNVSAVEEYVRTQPARHRTMLFDDEIFGLLDRHAIDYDKSAVLD